MALRPLVMHCRNNTGKMQDLNLEHTHDTTFQHRVKPIELNGHARWSIVITVFIFLL